MPERGFVFRDLRRKFENISIYERSDNSHHWECVIVKHIQGRYCVFPQKCTLFIAVFSDVLPLGTYDDWQFGGCVLVAFLFRAY